MTEEINLRSTHTYIRNRFNNSLEGQASSNQFSSKLDQIKACIQQTAEDLGIQTAIVDQSSEQGRVINERKTLKKDRTDIKIIIEKLSDKNRLEPEVRERCMGDKGTTVLQGLKGVIKEGFIDKANKSTIVPNKSTAIGTRG